MFDKLYYTVIEASELCDVTQTTIRKAIKSHKMKNYRDDRGVIHIYGPHLWDYRREIVNKKITKTIDEIYSCARKLNYIKHEYLEALADAEDCDEEDHDLLYAVWAQKKQELSQVNTKYIGLVEKLRNLEYEATVIYEVEV